MNLNKEEEMECLKCKYKNSDYANFCVMCGSKLNEICNCWIKKEPYNCGKEQCPSYRLYKKIIEEK